CKVLGIQQVVVKYLSFFILFLCPFNILASEIFHITDVSSYPEDSEKAVIAVINDLQKNNKELVNLFVLAKCDKKFCDLEVSYKDNFKLNANIRGCPNFCVYYGFNNEHGYIVKKAHIR
ncbi:hypothetical protein, partial [Paraglaciecola sp.]|uniref:hypothetical protein n=1 Tax=Paraglaciecola sp. TaxID=1920173 RepID=UPI0032991409